MPKLKCPCGYLFSELDIEEIENIPSKIGYCPIPGCHKEINLTQLLNYIKSKVEVDSDI